jgi:hypothetical protein
MRQHIFYRNVRARDQLEIFLLSAATSLLLVRFYLSVSGYPQIGGGGLHIAHMLWGGLLMVAALTLSLAFHGARVQRVVAVLGGIGFGVFIDELGKFITQDNNYFYRPTIGIIYALFIGLYLTFNFLGRVRGYTSREYQLNALAQLEEAVLHDLDPEEKRRVEALLAQARQDDPLTKHLQRLVEKLPTIPQPKPSRLTHWWRTLRTTYRDRWQRRNTNGLVRGFFLGEVLLFVLGGFFSLFANISGGAVNIDNIRGRHRPTRYFGDSRRLRSLGTRALEKIPPGGLRAIPPSNAGKHSPYPVLCLRPASIPGAARFLLQYRASGLHRLRNPREPHRKTIGVPLV